MSNEWIRIDAKLPKEPGRYLAYHYYMDVIVIVFWDGESWEEGYNITHWMSLPDSPTDWASVALGTGNLIEIEI